jgi:manganese/zinc/iron transport system permease protein
MNLPDWLAPWSVPHHRWLVATAACTALACGLPGVFLVLRRMSMTGDALSHSVLPGLVLGFLISGSLDSPWLILGAAASGWFTVMLIEWLHQRGGVREDAATGVAFTAMFSLGVLLLRLFADRVDLDPDCVLFGAMETAIHGRQIEIAGMGIPAIFLSSAGGAATAGLFVLLLHHRLVAAAFDPALAALLGLSPGKTRALLLAMTAAVLVTAFPAVGAVMSLALLVLPAATALHCCQRVPAVLAVAGLHGLLSAAAGLHLAIAAGINYGAAVVLCGAALFLAALAWHLFRHRANSKSARFSTKSAARF